MARFNAAFMSGSIDEKFQNRYNYLLDLLDTGYVVEKMIDGKALRIEISPQTGIEIKFGGNSVFGVDSTGAVFSTKLAYVDNPETKYGIIGDFPSEGYGLALYDTDFSSSPFFKICAVNDFSGTLDGVVLYDHNELPKIAMYGSGANTHTSILDSSGNEVIDVGETYITLNPVAGNSKLLMSNVTGIEFSWNSFSRMSIDSSESYLRSPNGANEIMVNNTNAYINDNIILHDGNIGGSFYQTDNSIDSNLTANNWPDGVKLMRVWTALNYPTSLGIVFSVKRATYCFQLFASSGGAMHKRTTTMSNYSFSAWSAL